MSTQSWNDAASTTSGPKRSHAHAIADVAGAVSSRVDCSASSPRSGTACAGAPNRSVVGNWLGGLEGRFQGAHVAHSLSPVSATYGPVSSKSM